MACAAALLAVVAGGVVLRPSPAPAGVAGSPHDFSSPGAPYSPMYGSGACSACHVPHRAETGSGAYVLWPRDLAAYRNKLLMNGVDIKPWGNREPNYVLSPTLQCYDCHDDHNAANFGDLPPLGGSGGFQLGHYPQDIAFGFTKTGPGAMSDDGPAGTVSGYYENHPPYPGSPAVNFGADPDLNPTDNAAVRRTGGHYFKRRDPDANPLSSSRYNIGDKLPCRDCHDPHAYSTDRQAFIRTNLPASDAVGPLGTVTASTYMANSTGTRNDAASRNICAACHAYSNLGTPVRYSNINSAYTITDTIPKPPDNVTGTTIGIPEHRAADGTACVSCHRHNAIEAACDQCHFYPGFAGGIMATDTHKLHVSQASETPVGRGYQCRTCHAVYAHNESGVTGTGDWGAKFSRTFVDVAFDNGWNPSGTYDNTLMRCSGLYCHGDSVTPANWGGTATKPTWDNASTAPCGSCHGTGSLIRTSNHPVHLDNVGKPYGPNTLDNATCAAGRGCHTAYGLSPTSTHVDNVKSFRLAPPDNTAVPFGTPTQVCAKCHSTASAPFDNNAAFGAGDNLARANWGDNTYRLPCLSCHNSTLQGNTKLDGSGRPAPNIEGYDNAWIRNGHGAAAIDNTATATTNATVDQVPAVGCGYCHGATTTAHFGPGKDTANPWRLLSATNFATAGGLDTFCQSQCHGPGLPADHTWNVAAGETKGPTDTHPTSTAAVPNAATYRIPPAEVPLRGVLTDNNAAPDGTHDILCVSCHDPHGVGPGASSPRAFTGVNTGTITGIDNNSVHMLRYDYGSAGGGVLCKKCHI